MANEAKLCDFCKRDHSEAPLGYFILYHATRHFEKPISIAEREAAATMRFLAEGIANNRQQ